jgi:NTE family protein
MHIVEAENLRTPQREERAALCLGGGGLRSALFQIGALRRWNELGLLSSLRAVHAVGGGALVAGLLAARWESLGRGLHGELSFFDAVVAAPIERFAHRRRRLRPTLRSYLRPRNWKKLAAGRFNPTDRFVEILDEQLFRGRRLADVSPFAPEIYWYATNLLSGSRWTFSRTEIGEPVVGYRSAGRVGIAEAAAASMISPATMPPLRLDSRPSAFHDGEIDGVSPTLRATALLVDGSIHDPLALETAIGEATTILVADGGASPHPEPAFDDWMGNRLFRSLEIQNHRAVELRRRWLIEMIRSGRLEGAYASLAAQHRDYGRLNTVGYSHSVVERIVRTPGDLLFFPRRAAELVVNHGYSIADAAAQRLLSHKIRIRAAFRLPHPDADGESVEFGGADGRSENRPRLKAA